MEDARITDSMVGTEGNTHYDCTALVESSPYTLDKVMENKQVAVV